MKQTYQERKEQVRQEAIEWQYDYFGTEDAPSISLGELAWWHDHFRRLGRRYGLLEEFRENGIC